MWQTPVVIPLSKPKEDDNKEYLRTKAREQLGKGNNVAAVKLLAHDMEHEIRERHIRTFKQTIVKAWSVYVLN